MNRIAGIVHFDGRAASAAQLRTMVDEHAPSGDCFAITHGPVGLASQDPPAATRALPAACESAPWIVSDARLDGRAELIRSLGRSPDDTIEDDELIRLAFVRWGADCFVRLLGDFSIAVWTGSCLWLARDHMGVKPLYKMRLERGLAFSTDLLSLRRHPEFDGELDEVAIADFLIEGFPRDTTSTAFSAITRVPPAHAESVTTDGRANARRFWELAPPRPKFLGPEEGREQFLGLLDECVDDRLRGAEGSLGIMLSGGLDSTSIAVTASRLIHESASRVALRACTMIGPGDPEDEARHARLVAGRANLAHDVYETVATESWERGAFSWVPPEPSDIAFQLPRVLLHEGRAPYRVALTGQGGDPALAPGLSDALLQIRQGRWLRAAVEAARHRLAFGRWPRIHLRRAIGRARNRGERIVRTLPIWVNREWAATLPWPERWGGEPVTIEASRFQRAEAYGDLSAPFWPHAFEALAALGSSFGVELRHPYFDVRMISWLINLPSSPWCDDKYLIREAMRDKLPERVRERPKTPLAGFASYSRLRARGTDWVKDVPRPPGLERFVDLDRVFELARTPSRMRDEEDFLVTRPLSLAVWLDRQ